MAWLCCDYGERVVSVAVAAESSAESKSQVNACRAEQRSSKQQQQQKISIYKAKQSKSDRVTSHKRRYQNMLWYGKAARQDDTKYGQTPVTVTLVLITDVII